MTGSDFLLKQQLLGALGKVEQTKRVSNRGTTLGHHLRDLGLRHVATFHKTTIPIRFLNGVQIRALDVFDERELERVIVVSLFDANGNLLKACHLACLPTTLASDNLIRVRACFPHKNWLQETVSLDRGRKLLKFFLLELSSRLIGVRADRVDGNLVRNFFHDARRGLMGNNLARSCSSGSLNGSAALDNSLDVDVVFRIGLVNFLAFEHFLFLQPTLGGSGNLSRTSCRNWSRGCLNGILIRAKKSI